MSPRLPVDNGDPGTWGGLLNTYLSVAHNADGSIKSGAVPTPDLNAWLVSNTGSTSLTDATSQNSLANTTAVAGSPVVSVSFVAPASGIAFVTVTGTVGQSVVGNFTYLGWECRLNNSTGTLITASAASRAVSAGPNVVSGGSAWINASNRYRLVGLTPGATYYVQTMHWVTGGTGTVSSRSIMVELSPVGPKGETGPTGPTPDVSSLISTNAPVYAENTTDYGFTATDATWQLGTSGAGTALTSTFVAPPSGTVWITLTGQLSGGASFNAQMSYSVVRVSNSTEILAVGNEGRLLVANANSLFNGSVTRSLTGLVSGESYTITVQHRSGGVGSNTVNFTFKSLLVDRGNYGDKGATGSQGPTGPVQFPLASGVRVCNVASGYAGVSAGPFPVTFPAGRFSTAPIVAIAQANLPGGSAKTVPKITAITASGFDVYLYNGDGSILGTGAAYAVNVNWIATDAS